jgi:hypothetical protein
MKREPRYVAASDPLAVRVSGIQTGLMEGLIVAHRVTRERESQGSKTERRILNRIKNGGTMKKRALVLALLLFAVSVGAKAAPFNLHTQTGNIDQSIGTNVALAAQVVTCTDGANGHCVLLSWTASTTPGTQVNIFRGATSGGESTTPVNAAPVPSGTTSYNDGTPIGLTTYFYRAQAVCVAGSTPACPAGSNPTSAYSNEISVNVPGTVVAPPANLTGTAQ